MNVIRSLLILAALALHLHATDAKKPNVLFLFAGDPAHAGRRHALFQRLLALQKELGDSLELTTAFPNL
jgi:hypothetical protein